jgi:hypothetical protein
VVLLPPGGIDKNLMAGVGELERLASAALAAGYRRQRRLMGLSP